MSENSTFFKELTPRSRTYELRGQGGKKAIRIKDKQTPHTVLQKAKGGKKLSESKTNKHLTLSYKRPRGEKSYQNQRQTNTSHCPTKGQGGKKAIRIKDKQTPHTVLQKAKGGKKLSESKTNKHLTLSYKRPRGEKSYQNQRQTNTSHCPTKTISKNDTYPLKIYCIMNTVSVFVYVKAKTPLTCNSYAFIYSLIFTINCIISTDTHNVLYIYIYIHIYTHN